MNNSIFDSRGFWPVLITSLVSGFGIGMGASDFIRPRPPQIPPMEITLNPTDRLPWGTIRMPDVISDSQARTYIQNFGADHSTYSRAINIPTELIDALNFELKYRTADASSISGFRVYYGKTTGAAPYNAIVLPVNSTYRVVARSDNQYLKVDVAERMSNPCPDMCDGETASMPPL